MRPFPALEYSVSGGTTVCKIIYVSAFHIRMTCIDYPSLAIWLRLFMRTKKEQYVFFELGRVPKPIFLAFQLSAAIGYNFALLLNKLSPT